MDRRREDLRGSRRRWNKFIRVPVGRRIGQGAVDGRVPVGKGIDPIVSGPFAAEVNLEIRRVELVHRPMLNTPSNGKELLIIDDMILWGNIAGAEVSDESHR